MNDTKKYIVEFTEEHMRVLHKAVEMYMRLMMGQDWDFSEEIAGLGMDLSTDNPRHKELFNLFLLKREDIRYVMRSVFHIAFGHAGVPEEKTDDMLTAETIWDAIRTSRGVNRWDKAYQWGKEPIPKIEVIE